MSRSLNKVQLIGNLGADPEVKYAASGTAIANFNLATQDRRKNRDGEWEETTEWHRIVSFGKLAEVCKDYLNKGSKIYAEGRLQTRSWDKNGQKHYMTEVVMENMIMLDGKPQQGQPDRNTNQNQGRGQEEDLPF